ncbi:MAG: SDR family NAD(P)-dependent oxidoreductase [Porphyrobacter sp.]|jgi:short-subunit dehydrogenase|nr:SDR family NAD(P)-dependent oxidoreductase [Porphyrobacter sp.]
MIKNQSDHRDCVTLPVLLTGASGNLGGELARQLARPGVRLSLWGRDLPRLESTAQACRDKGAQVAVRVIDLADTAAARSAFAAEDEAAPFAMVLLVAGQGATLAAGATIEDPEQVASQCHLNFTATAALAAAVAERMCARGHGRIGIIGSAAAAHSLPFAPSYAASKAGLARFADALRLAARPHGVSVTLATPGFISAGSNAAAARPPRPFEIPVERVARAIITAVDARAAERVVPRWFTLLKLFDRALPRPLRDRLLSSLPNP